MYTRLNHLNITLSYTGVLALITSISKQHKVPIQKWIDDGASFKFVGDNVDKKRGVRDIRSDHHSELKHMYSLIAVRSRVESPSPPSTFSPPDISREKVARFLPSKADVEAIKANLVVLVSRVLCTYMKVFRPQKGSVTQHISHLHSADMTKRSEVIVCDVFHKNETRRDHMIDIMEMTQDFLGDGFSHTVASGGDLLTVERQQAAHRHLADADTPRERLEYLEPVSEDWHALMNYLMVSIHTLLYRLLQYAVCASNIF